MVHGGHVVRVVVVDDHRSYRGLVVRLLRAGGFDVVGEAGTGAGAVDVVRQCVPEVVLLDVLLPDFDGFEVARRLLALRIRPMIVFLSSRERDEFGDFVEGLDCRFLSKDRFTVDRLRDLLAED